MKTFLEKLENIKAHFNNGDVNLGFRFTIDCVLECNSIDLLDRIIDLAPFFANEQYKELTELSLELLNDLAKEKINIIDPNTPLLEVSNIRKKYNKFNLSPISLTLYPGDVWGLVGENGNGKTTLLRILASDLQHNSGEVKYNFSQKKSAYDLRTDLIYIEQRTPRYFGSIKDNLKFAASQYGIKGKQNERMVLIYLIRFGLWNFRLMKWSELSSGYKMRFELAKTFLRKPKLLLLDEPLANLDILTQQVVLEDLKNISASLSNPIGIILSSQQLFEVEKIANHVLFLKQGKPTLLNSFNLEDKNNYLYLELDLECSKGKLIEVLQPFNVISLEYNGGVFNLQIKDEKLQNIVIELFNHQIEIKYLRDISKSSRRLFNAK